MSRPRREERERALRTFHIAISACNFLNSSSSSSSSTGAFVFPLTVKLEGLKSVKIFYLHEFADINRPGLGGEIWKSNSLSPFAALGALLKLSATGTVPVFSIFSSRFSCSSAARSASSSSSSMGSVMGMDVMALPISWVSSCCSRSCSLEM